MPSSGARSGTRPSRSARGAGSGRVGGYELACGHVTHANQPVVRAVKLADSLWQCPSGCGLVKRHYGGTHAATEKPPAKLLACPNCGGDRDEPTLRFCATCRRTVL